MSLDDLPDLASLGAVQEAKTTVRRGAGVRGVDKLTRAEELRLQLADEIVRGALAPGAALDETDIARRFNVSRTPVREAMRQLAASAGWWKRAPIAARWWRGPRSSAEPACSRRWRNWKRCAPGLPRSG